MTMRLSKSSFTGTARTDVAVGSSSEAFMFFATAADGPRSVTYSGPVGAGLGDRGAPAFAGAALAGAALAAALAGAGFAGAAVALAAGFAAGCAGPPAAAVRRPAWQWAGACVGPAAAGPGEPAARCGGGARGFSRRCAGRSRGVGRPACSRRRSPTRLGLPSSGPGGTAGRSRRRATRWDRTRRRVLTLPVLVGRDARAYWGTVTTRRQPPSSASQGVDSGNKGYASMAGRCRPGGVIVVQVTSGDVVSAHELAGNKRGSAARVRNAQQPRLVRLTTSASARSRHRTPRIHSGSGSNRYVNPADLGRPGRVTWIRQPRGDSATPIRPPCRSTAQRAIARPRPVPPSLPGTVRARGRCARG